LWQWPRLSNATTVALGFLVVVLLVAATARLWVAVTTSIVAMLAFNFFFLPPVGAFVIADPQNWVALVAFLAVSLVASNLSAVARDRTQEAVMRRDELGRLFDLSRDVLLLTDSEAANSSLALSHASLEYVAICLPRGTEWIVLNRALGRRAQPGDLSAAFSAGTTTVIRFNSAVAYRTPHTGAGGHDVRVIAGPGRNRSVCSPPQVDRWNRVRSTPSRGYRDRSRARAVSRRTQERRTRASGPGRKLPPCVAQP
jgi:hypothetical protein